MIQKYNKYIDADGITHIYLMDSDYDTPIVREKQSKINKNQYFCNQKSCFMFNNCNRIPIKCNYIKCKNYKK